MAMATTYKWLRQYGAYQRINEIGLLIIIVLLYLGFWLYANNFMTFNNQITILRDASFIGIAAWGATLIIISGDIDISVGPAVAFISVIFAYMLKSHFIPLPLAFLLAILLGGGLVGIAGVLRAYFDVSSFIATLGLWSAFGGLALYMTQAIPVSYPSNAVLDWLDGRILGVPTPAIIMLGLCALFIFISRKTVFGRAVYAIGGNATAAHLVGIKVARVRVMLFVIAGMCAAVTAILITARNGIGDAGLARSGMEFDVIAAVVIGGTSLSGGRGSISGTFLGIFIISLIGNGLVLLGLDSFLQSVVRGVIIVAAVLLNILGQKRKSKKVSKS